MESDFANPAASAPENAEAYVSRLLKLLGGRDPLEVQGELILRLRDQVEGLGESELQEREAPGKWSILEVVYHLADTELVYSYRMRMSVAQPGSQIPDYDQDRWATGLMYNRGSLETALRHIDVLRSANLEWLRGLSDEELDRAGIHEERGPESVRQIIELLAAHDLVHLNQIERIRTAIL